MNQADYRILVLKNKMQCLEQIIKEHVQTHTHRKVTHRKYHVTYGKHTSTHHGKINLQFIGMDERVVYQVNDIDNIFNKSIGKNSPKLKKKRCSHTNKRNTENTK